MILSGKLDRILKLGENCIISFLIPTYLVREEVPNDVDLKIEITKYKSKRSLFQNAKMWALIHDIARNQGMDDLEVYRQLIRMSGIKTEFIETIPESVDRLKAIFRDVVEVERRTSKKGVETVVLELFYGTSTFDTVEMSEFIDRLLDYATNIGLSVEEYNGRF